MAIAAFGAGLLLPALGKSRETANRVKCASNLRQIGLAMLQYSSNNRGNYPRTKFVGADTLIPDVSNGGAESPNPFAAGTTVPNNCVPAAVFLLLRTEDIIPAVFNCPSSKTIPDENGRNAMRRSNFTDIKMNLSYSFANPYPDNAALAAGYRANNRLDAGFVLAGDLNPGLTDGNNAARVTTLSSAAEVRSGNSRNHRKDGQNFLFADGHVEFDASSLVGVNQDNVYCRGKGAADAGEDSIINSPKDPNDSVLLPVDKD
jgi:prepilin-type processing-associated H-X9-DG protein